MIIRRLQCLAGAKQAAGLVVVMDIFRASSTIVTLLARGAEAVRPVATVEEARALKSAHPDWVLAGERGGLPPEGFDFGNSPHEAEQRDWHGRTVVLTTSAGSKGLVAAAAVAEQVVVGCFLNASAVVEHACRHLNQTSTDAPLAHRHGVLADPDVSLVALGVCGDTPSPEDDLCADLLEQRLRGQEPDFAAMVETIRVHPEGAKFLDPHNRAYVAEDFHACLQLDRYDVVPVLHADGFLRAV